MDKVAMKSVGFFFVISFVFFFIGQAFWTYGIFMETPLLGSKDLD